MTTVYIALGTNLGDRPVNLAKALSRMADFVSVIKRSPIYETAPMYLRDQPEFLNMVVEAETELDPRELLDRLKHVEEELGREEDVRFGPRLIDLDILFFGNRVIEEPNLAIPHRRFAERAFVLRPLCDIAPDLIDPRTGHSMDSLLTYLTDDGGVRPYTG